MHHTRRAQDVRRRSSFQPLIRCHKLTSRGPCTTERRQKGSSPGCGFRERNFPLGYGFPVWKYHRGPPWLSATIEHERSERGGKISDGCRGAQDDPCKNAEMGRSISGQHGCSGDAALPRLPVFHTIPASFSAVVSNFRHPAPPIHHAQAHTQYKALKDTVTYARVCVPVNFCPDQRALCDRLRVHGRGHAGHGPCGRQKAHSRTWSSYSCKNLLY